MPPTRSAALLFTQVDCYDSEGKLIKKYLAPLVETVMNGIKMQQGISYTCRTIVREDDRGN